MTLREHVIRWLGWWKPLTPPEQKARAERERASWERRMRAQQRQAELLRRERNE